MYTPDLYSVARLLLLLALLLAAVRLLLSLFTIALLLLLPLLLLVLLLLLPPPRALLAAAAAVVTVVVAVVVVQDSEYSVPPVKLNALLPSQSGQTDVYAVHLHKCFMCTAVVLVTRADAKGSISLYTSIQSQSNLHCKVF
jgi:hypothetical protein